MMKSRLFQVCIVSASLFFVLSLSVSLWLDAFEQRRNALQIQHASVQEEALLTLADAVSSERRQANLLINSVSIDQAAVERLKSLVDETRAIASKTFGHQGEVAGHSAAGPSMPTHASPMDESAMPESAVMPDHAMDEHAMPEGQAMSAQGADEHPIDHVHDGWHSTSQTGDISELLQGIDRQHEVFFSQLERPVSLRDPGLGMAVFHQYSTLIEFLNDHRRKLYIAPSSSRREFYVHSRLKDVTWEFREAVKQISALLQGLVAMAGSAEAEDLQGIRHHADMLTELNVRVDLAWNQLLKLGSASNDAAFEAQASDTGTWYIENFRARSSSLAAASRYNGVSLAKLRQWSKVADQLLTRADRILADSRSITLASMSAVRMRATLKLLVVSILVLLSLGITLASIVFFRRADKQAHRDELTGLDNRRSFCLDLNALIGSTRQSASSLGLLMIDLDRFKYINDTMGHAAGDQLLKAVAKRIGESTTGCKSFARLGGDEFAMLFVGHDAERLLESASRVRAALVRPFSIDEAIVHIGSSIGVAQFPRDADSHDELIKVADLAMYCAKKSGTNQIVLYEEELDQSMASTARLVSDLQAAIQEEQFELYYQPQFDLSQNKVVSVEALIRWNHPLRGFVPPDDFIPVAETNGLMPLIGNWVLNEACRQAAAWLHESNLPLRVAVNISAEHFFQPDFVGAILDCLKRHQLPPQLLELEVTESVAVNDMDIVVQSLARLRESSIHVALDDFGTGYSSLSYLQDLPLDTLKIDKSFIQKMLCGNLQHDSITAAIVSLGQSLDLQTVAEGVETADQLTAVSDMQISVVQGYYYSKPVAASDLGRVVSEINAEVGARKAA